MFLQRLKKALHARRSVREDGNDLIITLFFLPVLLAVAMGVVDLSMYFQTKTEIQIITRDVTRTAALFGGAGYNSPLSPQYADNSQGKLTQNLMDRLYDSSTDKCLLSYCYPRSSEVPYLQNLWRGMSTASNPGIVPGCEAQNQTLGAGGSGVNPACGVRLSVESITAPRDYKVWTQCSPCVTTAIGEHITCSVVYNFAGVGGAITYAFGFGQIVDIPIQVSETFQTETQFTTLGTAAEFSCNPIPYIDGNPQT